jgi:hypothetical protein
VASVDDHAKYLRSEPTDMSNIKPTTNSQLPDRLYGERYPDSFLDMPRSVRESNVATLGDYIRHLQEVDKQSDQSCVACFSPESKFDHICPNNPILTCNCTDPKFCAELGNDPDGNNANGNKVCPDSGKVCNTAVCPTECLGDKDGFSDNLDYTGIPIPTSKGKAAVRGWPCIVVGAIPEAWDSTGERVSGCEHSKGYTERNIDAGLDNDGLAATTKI